MRRSILLLPLAFVIAAAPEALEAVRGARPAIERAVLSAATTGWAAVPWELVEAARPLDGPRRAQAAKIAVEIARKFSESPGFRESFAAGRSDAGPTLPTPARTAAQLAADAKREIETSLAEAERAIADMPKEHRAAARAQIEQSRKAVTEMVGDRNFEEDAKADKQRYEAEKAEYDAAVERLGPADPKGAVRAQLRRLLAATEGVRHDAKLVECGGLRCFADEALEAKADEWKQCFRAGKEACEAARAAARAWLAALE